MISSKTIKIVLVILLSLILLGVSTSVFATTPLNATNGTNGTIVIVNPNEGTTGNNNTNRTNTINSINTTTYGNSNLPQTGSADYVIIGFAVVCIISAVYAYKKVKDYKI